MITLNIDAPETSRAAVTFNGDKRGLLTTAEKAQADAKNFRWIADIISQGQFGAGAAQENAARARGALITLADQFDAAANGDHPQAQ